jgi:hypothetical protein
MLSSRAVLLFALAVGALINGAPRAQDPIQTGSSSIKVPYVMRVFYLQGMEPLEAMTLLRSQIQVVQIATIRDRNIIVVADVADRVDRSESLLRQRDAVVRATDPHQPLNLERLPESTIATRVFRIEDADISTVVTVLRSIYQMREVTKFVDENSVSVRAALPILDASEATLRELGLLVEEAKASGSM